MSNLSIFFLHRILSLVGVLALFSLSESRAVFDQGKVNCFIKHLKSEGKLESSYPEATVANHIEHCEDNVKDLKKEAYKKVALTVRRKSDFGEYTTCIMAGLRSKHWAEEIMLKIVYEASLTLSAEEKETKLATADAAIEDTVEEAFFLCVVDKEFGGMFDSMMKKDASSSSEEDDPFEDYCARKLVVDNKLIDTVKYNVILNPKNLDVSAANCEQVLEKAFKTLEVAVTKTLKDDDDFNFDDKESQCIINKYREQNFGQKLMRLGVLSELDVTAETKEEEKKNFIQTMYELVRMVKACK